MLKQEQEFKAWGLSKIAVRNIVVFFFCLLISIIGVLARAYVLKDTERRESDLRLLECKELATEAVEKFKNEQLEQMGLLLMRQDSLGKRLNQLTQRLKKLQRK